MNNKQLFIHEHNAGSGKSHSMINLIKNLIDAGGDLDVLISVPSKKLQSQYGAQLPNALIINDDTRLGSTSVTQYIIDNQDKIQSTKIVIITHATLLTNGNMFGERCLIVDELPSGLININCVQTTKADADVIQGLLDGESDSINHIIKQREEGSVEYSAEKITMLKACVDNLVFGYVRSTPTGDYDYFNYLHYVDAKLFTNFEHIHLMGANLKKSNAIAYFSKICGYDFAMMNPNRLGIRGNPMDQVVRLVPLLKFEGDRDFISKDVLDSHIDRMLAVVKANSDAGIIVATNNRHQNTIGEDKHFELISAVSHGLNCYKERTQAAVLYSANPNPMLIPFMKHCATVLGLPENYLVESYVYENMLDVVYQTVTRTAIRDIDFKGELTFFVPDQRAAEFLADRFKNAVTDWSLAIEAETNSVGAPLGNTNKKGKGCPVVAMLVKAGATNNKAARLIANFVETNGFKPNELEPKHMIKLLSALKFKRVPANFSYKVDDSYRV